MKGRDHFQLLVRHFIFKCKLSRFLLVRSHFSLTWNGFLYNVIGADDVSHELSFFINLSLFYPADPSWCHDLCIVLRFNRSHISVLNLLPGVVTFIAVMHYLVLDDISPRFVNRQNRWSVVTVSIEVVYFRNFGSSWIYRAYIASFFYFFFAHTFKLNLWSCDWSFRSWHIRIFFVLYWNGHEYLQFIRAPVAACLRGWEKPLVLVLFSCFQSFLVAASNAWHVSISWLNGSVWESCQVAPGRSLALNFATSLRWIDLGFWVCFAVDKHLVNFTA